MLLFHQAKTIKHLHNLKKNKSYSNVFSKTCDQVSWLNRSESYSFHCPHSITDKQLCRGLALMQIWRWQDSVMMCAFFLNAYVVFTQTIIDTVHLYIIQLYVWKLPCGTHTKSNWKWMPKYVDCNVQKECLLSYSTSDPATFY